MARRKDLTALAALGTLGYMLSKRGDKKDDKKAETPSLENLPVARPSMKPNPLITAGEEQGKPKDSGDAGVAEYYANKPRNPEAIQEADNPRVSSPASKPTASASKPAASKPSGKKEVGESVSVNQPKTTKKSESVTSDMRGVTSETRVPRFTPNEPPVQTGRRDFEESQRVPVDETKLSLSERMKLSRERSKSGSGPTDRRSVSERIRSSMGMKSGGSVSSASRRADGIATKGKTRGKIC